MSATDHPASPRSPGDRLRRIPGVDRVLAELGPEVERSGHAATVAAVRGVLEVHRESVRTDATAEPPDAATVAATVRGQLAADPRGAAPRPVLNATGVVIHTNLGRAPLSSAAVGAVRAAAGYCDLEYDLDRGERGSRGSRIDPALAELCGAPAATVVNNAAGALVLVLAAHAAGRGVVVSRGELVEIGGSFRLPDILEVSGARLVEVGTTNRTRADDYRTGDDVALLLRMHASNYRIVGFTAAPTVAELAEVAADRGVPLVFDVGSGLLEDPHAPWSREEPTVRGALADGADLVIASGDKILGGPQAGIIAGRADLVAACRRHPLARALRLDKLRIAALAATVEAHRAGTAAVDVPVWRMLTATAAELGARSRRFVAALEDDAHVEPGGAAGARGAGGAGGATRGHRADVVDGVGVVGGGAAPGTGLAGPVVRIRAAHADDLVTRLRAGSPPVVVRMEDGAILLDLRTVDPDDDRRLAAAVAAVLGGG